MTSPSTDASPPAAPTFASFGLREPLLQALRDVGYTAPTPVQSECFALVAEGRDIIVQSRTGSGKTAAFALPLLDRIIRAEKGVQTLVLCPTRELALQVAGEFERLGRHLDVGVIPVYGGAAMGPQVDALERGVQVVAGTPGRVLDHLRRGTFNPKGLKAIVLDEADEMLSMGFAEELNAILELLPRTRQTLLFSATMPEQIQRMAKRHQRDPAMVSLSSDNVAPTGITHLAYFSPSGSRLQALVKVLEAEKPEAALIFCNTKSDADSVARSLKSQGFKAGALHGDMSQSEREEVLGRLRDEKLPLLAATDVAARGIDVPHLTHVFHFGFPDSAESYVHRSGRTGRAGRAGTAVSLVGPQDIGNLYFLRLTYGIRPIERTLPTDGEERTRREDERVQFLSEAFGDELDEAARSIARRVLASDEPERLVAGLIAAFFDTAAKPEPAPAPAPTRSVPAPRPDPAAVAVSEGERPRRTERSDRGERGERSDRGERGERRERRERRPEAPPVTAATAATAVEPGAEAAPEAPATAAKTEATADVTTEAPAPTPRPRRVAVRHTDRDELAAQTSDDDEAMEDIRISVGKADGLRTGELVRFIRERAGLAPKDLGRVKLRDHQALVQVRAEKTDAILESLEGTTYNERTLDAVRARGAAPLPDDAPEAPVAPAPAPAPEAAPEGAP